MLLHGLPDLRDTDQIGSRGKGTENGSGDEHVPLDDEPRFRGGMERVRYGYAERTFQTELLWRPGTVDNEETALFEVSGDVDHFEEVVVEDHRDIGEENVGEAPDRFSGNSRVDTHGRASPFREVGRLGTHPFESLIIGGFRENLGCRDRALTAPSVPYDFVRFSHRPQHPSCFSNPRTLIQLGPFVNSETRAAAVQLLEDELHSHGESSRTNPKKALVSKDSFNNRGYKLSTG